MNTRNFGPIQAALVSALLLTIPALSVAGTWVVVAAEQTTLQAGDLLDGSKSVTLTTGARLTLLAENGKTLKLVGPYSGVPASEGAASAQKSADLAVIANLLQGHQQKSTVLGVVRGDTSKSPPDANLISADKSGSRCLSSDSAVLWRANAADPEQLTVADAQGKVIASFAWPAGQARLTIPVSTFEDGKSYRLQRDFQSVNLQIYKAPPLTDNPTAQVAWMARSGCNEQALSRLKGL